ncbi:hypothetical protein [Pontimicrobium sp. IMCC45349]|jgi:hypothetical protein|uniref:hypothetical protein n=1 Tax=Pontimicrobium sp. IMCC45349 TaxID=3391574 RepID=UPI0039A23D60
MTFKRLMRLIILAFIIAFASILPMPITFYRKDHLPKNLIEHVENIEEEDDENDVKELF